MIRPLLLTLLLAACAPAFAIYKCESDGKTVYGDTPCPGGRTLDAAPAADAAPATREAARQKEEAARLERARHQREAQEERAQQKQARTAAAQRKKCASLALRRQWAEEDAAKANPKAAPKAQQTARRAAEKHQLECGK